MSTIIQSICDITAMTPMFAIAVCAIVLTARMSALRIHARTFSFSYNHRKTLYERLTLARYVGIL